MMVTCPHCGESFNASTSKGSSTPLGAARLAKALSIAMVCKALGPGRVSARQMSRIEQGLSTPSLDVARDLARLYESSVDVLWPAVPDNDDVVVDHNLSGETDETAD